MDRLPTMPPDAGGATVPVALSVELALTAPALTRTRSRFTRRAGCGGPVICARVWDSAARFLGPPQPIRGP